MTLTKMTVMATKLGEKHSLSIKQTNDGPIELNLRDDYAYYEDNVTVAVTKEELWELVDFFTSAAAGFQDPVI